MDLQHGWVTWEKIAIENINKNNSILNNKAVNYDIQYSQCNKRKVLSKTNDLILEKGVDVIIGDACSVTSEYAGLLAAEYNLPFITFSTSNDNLDDRTVYNTLTMVKGTLDALGQVIIQVSKGNGLSNICLYSSQRSYLTFIERGVEGGSKLNNVTIIDKINHKEAENFRPTMRIVKQNCRGMAIIFSHWNFMCSVVPYQFLCFLLWKKSSQVKTTIFNLSAD